MTPSRFAAARQSGPVAPGMPDCTTEDSKARDSKALQPPICEPTVRAGVVSKAKNFKDLSP